MPELDGERDYRDLHDGGQDRNVGNQRAVKFDVEIIAKGRHGEQLVVAEEPKGIEHGCNRAQHECHHGPHDRGPVSPGLGMAECGRARVHWPRASRVAQLKIDRTKLRGIKFHAGATGDYGSRIEAPVVARLSRSMWDFMASLSGYFWFTAILSFPLSTMSNRSWAIASRSSRLAA